MTFACMCLQTRSNVATTHPVVAHPHSHLASRPGRTHLSLFQEPRRATFIAYPIPSWSLSCSPSTHTQQLHNNISVFLDTQPLHCMAFHLHKGMQFRHKMAWLPHIPSREQKRTVMQHGRRSRKGVVRGGRGVHDGERWREQEGCVGTKPFGSHVRTFVRSLSLHSPGRSLPPPDGSHAHVLSYSTTVFRRTRKLMSARSISRAQV